jgi:hypothetical protein
MTGIFAEIPPVDGFSISIEYARVLGMFSQLRP